MSVNHSARSVGIIGIFFSIFFNMKVCCVFLLELPHRGNSNEYTNEYTKHIIFNIKKKITLNYPKYNYVWQLWDFFLGTQELVRNSHGKRVIGVRAIEVLLYLVTNVWGGGMNIAYQRRIILRLQRLVHYLLIALY